MTAGSAHVRAADGDAWRPRIRGPGQVTVPMIKKKRSSSRQKAFARLVVSRLQEAYPDAQCALIHNSPFQLLVATILSAQCTDVRVNMVTPALFARFGTPRAMAAADRTELENLIRTTGFFRNKARHIQNASLALVRDFAGEVPANMEDLLTLPGVARKTANVVLGVAFGIADGVVVDTHVKRIAFLLGLTRQRDPAKVEIDLMSRLPEEEWIDFSHRVILHGRAVCKARRPRCAACSLNDICPAADLA